MKSCEERFDPFVAAIKTQKYDVWVLLIGAYLEFVI
jgi:hypothetical protein